MNLSALVATGFGLGYLPAPGTIATICLGLPCTLLWRRYIPAGMSTYIALVISILISGVYIAYALPSFQEGDPKEIVIDEVVGTLVACVGGPGTVSAYATRILLFRILDITKIWPIGWSERLPGALGIMADDVLAGLFAHMIALSIGL